MRTPSHSVQLPSGHLFDPARPRSDGPLNDEELAWCRSAHVPLGYDAAQTGWVTLLGEDDIDPDTLPARQGWSAADAPAVRLRRWTRDDVETMRLLLDDPEVWRYLPEPYPAPLTREVAADLIQVAAIEHHHEVRAVEHEGRVVGQVRLLFDRHGADRSGAEISYWLGRAHWGRGLGSVLVREATASAWARHPQLVRITARVHPDNGASAAILQQAGYRPLARDDGWLGFEVLRSG